VGEVLRDGFGTEHAIIYKREADLVTEIDEEAERVIRDELLGTFPSYRMLVEESSRVRRKPAGSWTPWTAPSTTFMGNPSSASP
jgi:fructose-1,6-bisphosphatase/inositol monophosphatase family enzyme